MHRSVVAAGLVIGIAVAGCGGDDGKETTPGNSSTTTSSTRPSTTTTSRSCVVTGTEAMKENALAPVDQLLTDVTTQSDGCSDSITFTFRPSAAAAPSYRVEYADPPFLDTAGRDSTPPGAAFLKIRFQPAWIADLSQESAPLTYTGPRVITPAGATWMKGLALFDATEAVVGWVVGLDARHPFTVEASSGRAVVTIG